MHFICLEKRTTIFPREYLVLGTGNLAAQIGEMVSANYRNFVLAGYASCFVCTSEGDTEIVQPVVPPDAILGNCDDLLDVALRAQAEVIVVALSERRKIFPLRDVLRCKLNGIQIMEAPSFYELVQGRLMLESITPSWFIFSNGFRRTSKFSICKRFIDIVLSCIGLLLTLPFFPLIALAIKLDSPGPVFFRQERFGNKEKRFELYQVQDDAPGRREGDRRGLGREERPADNQARSFFQGIAD